MNRAHVCRIYPTPEQAVTLAQFMGASRFVYNLGLEQRRDWWRQFRISTGKSISWASQCAETTALRKGVDWLAGIPRAILDNALFDLDRAFSAFLRRKRGFPSFRKADRHQTIRLAARDCAVTRLNAKWSAIRIPKIGKIKVRETRETQGRPLNVTIRRAGSKWFAVVTSEVDCPAGYPAEASVGIDMGVATTVALSSGDRFSLPKRVREVAQLRRKAQRALARRKNGSRRRLKQKAVVAELHRRAAASRAHWLHERSAEIARRFRHVAIEKLAVTNMTRAGRGKRGLNRSILEQGWSIFASMLEYKLAERGGTLHLVNPAYTSQTCSECGSVNAESRKSQAIFQCVDCGHRAHADTNAAINILRRSPAGVEGAGYGPVEARTGKMLTHLENLAA